MDKPNFSGLLEISNDKYSAYLLSYAKNCLNFDFPDGTWSRFTRDDAVSAEIVAYDSGVFAFTDEVKLIVSTFTSLNVEFLCDDGCSFEINAVLVRLSGRLTEVLYIERFLLNLLARAIGIATSSKNFVGHMNIFKNKCHLLLTSKTILGPLDKKAGLAGGALSHRTNYCHALIIKDTHKKSLLDFSSLDFSGLDFVEVEVESRDEALFYANQLRSISARVDCGIMFDNFAPSELSVLLPQMSKDDLLTNIFTEASGGINIDNISQYDIAGLNYISTSVPTQNPYTINLSLNLDIR